jgi:hypothetical protein
MAPLSDASNDDTGTGYSAVVVLSSLHHHRHRHTTNSAKQHDLSDNLPASTRSHRSSPLFIKLRGTATSIINKQAAQAWSLDAGYIFFDERLYVPAASPLLLALIDTLISGSPPSGGIS